MPNTALDELLGRMEPSELIAAIVLPSADISTLLTRRDGAPFDDAWVTAFNRVAERRGATIKSVNEDRRVTRLRELAYLQAYNRWKSSDLAAYISDDFGLIGNALALEFDDHWIENLLSRYLAGAFPVDV